MTPRASLIQADLYTNGGDVYVDISSNGIDFSNSGAFTYTYDPLPVITKLHPSLIFYDDAETEITITGSNFANTPLLKAFLSL